MPLSNVSIFYHAGKQLHHEGPTLVVQIIIVAIGFDEGGTLPDMTLGTFSIVPLIVDAVDHTPVMAAGGIADHLAFDAAFALGAEGVYCGTAFLMSEESRMAQNVKEAVLKANAKDLLLFRTTPRAHYEWYSTITCGSYSKRSSIEQSRTWESCLSVCPLALLRLLTRCS